MEKSFYIVDGHWQIFRAYYAPFRDLTSTTGEPTKATYVFTTMLLKLITEQRPHYLAVAMDSGREGLRRTEIYPNYKIQRAKPPEDFAPQVQRIVQIIHAMGVPLVALRGAEADDIMATAVEQLGRHAVRTVLVSRDKDLEQMLGPSAVMYDPTKDEFIDPAKLMELKGYPPERAVEVQALSGDATDNVPGVKGIGPKTAAKLINQYGTVENVLAHLDELSPKLAENLKTHEADALLSRQLVTLRRDVDFDFTDLEKFAFTGIRVDQLKPIFTELGFGRIIDQLAKLDPALLAKSAHGHAARTQLGSDVHLEHGGTAAGEAEQAEAATIPAAPREVHYRCIETVEAFEELAAELAKAKRFALNAQLTSELPMWADLAGIAFSLAPGEGAYVPLAGPLGARTLDADFVLAKLRPILADAAIEKIGHDLKRDLIVLENLLCPVAGKLFDAMLAAYVLDAGRASYQLANLAGEILGHRAINVDDVVGRGKTLRQMNHVPVEVVTPYACERADLAFRLHDMLGPQLQREKLAGLFEDMEMALMPVLVEMEREGVRIDPEELNRQRVQLARQADTLRAEIIQASGREFNVDSPRQLAEVLYQELQLPQLKKTKTGPSTDSSVLIELSSLHPVPGLILDYRQVTKLLSTYLSALCECILPRTQRVHTSFNQTGTATGRLSSSDPNLQNIPIRSDLGRQIRAAFTAGEGDLIISADYSQIELRILAHLCEDETLLAAFAADEDIHRIVAAEVFACKPEEVTPKQRSRAKTVNFGIIYGQTAFGLAATLRIPRREAQEFIDRYRARFPKIQHFLARCVQEAKANGYVCTLAGRRRTIDGFDSANPQKRNLAERLAINSVVQGSAADLIKIAMIRIAHRLRKEQRPTRMILQIHDELLFESPAAAAEIDQELIRQEMCDAMTLKTPLKVDIGIGPNWRDAK